MTTNPNPESLLVLEDQVPFAIPNSVEQDCQSRVCGRSIYDEIDKDLIALASNPAFEVHPIEGGEILTQADNAPSAIEIIPSSEPEPVAFFTPESIELEPLSVPFEDESNAKFKKAVPCGQTPKKSSAIV
ncbi:unnamed protein product [Bemisia tabaci]|uniref:Uncharacterized protein n=1 Tax=Bemisia tabaci TaxID=7038 RepID=A0A9P0F5J7_BEMTA|nr:unnamed protein product [Bemisia tabaci]